MSNCLMAYPDKTLNSTLSGGSFEALLPLNNLKTKALIDVARTTNAANASTTWDCDLGSTTHVRVLSLINHNASPSATIRVRFSTVADFSSTVYDSGTINMYSPVYPNGGLPYAHPDFYTGGVITQAELVSFPKDRYFVLTDGYSIQARYYRVEIFDSGNVDGYFQLSRCFVAPAWEPGSNMNYGAGMGYESATIQDGIPGSVTYYDVRKSRRFISASFELNTAQGVSFPLEMQRKLDISGELFFVFDAAHSTLVEKQQSFLCTMRELSALEYAYFDNTTIAKRFTEVL